MPSTHLRRPAAAVATLVIAGSSTALLTAAPASAADEVCGPAGTQLSPGVCEATFTSGTSTFTLPAEATQLEALLVGAGGASGAQSTSSGRWYASSGGGGEVRLIDLTGSTGDATVSVSSTSNPGGLLVGGTTYAVARGGAGSANNEVSGVSTDTSGNVRQPRQYRSGNNDPYGYGAGAGAGSDARDAQTGGRGVIVSDIAPAGSLFADDHECYGGGGAPVLPSVSIYAMVPVLGVPGCGGGGAADATGDSVLPPTPNHGGGAAGRADSPGDPGADGVIVLRWQVAVSFVVTFDMNGHGTAPADQTVTSGGTATAPEDPAADGYTFDGWFLDEELTTPADFTVPITAATTFHAKWTVVPVVTPSPTPSQTQTQTPSPSTTPTPTPGTSVTATPTPTPTPIDTPTQTDSPTPTQTSTQTSAPGTTAPTSSAVAVPPAKNAPALPTTGAATSVTSVLAGIAAVLGGVVLAAWRSSRRRQS